MTDDRIVKPPCHRHRRGLSINSPVVIRPTGKFGDAWAPVTISAWLPNGLGFYVYWGVGEPSQFLFMDEGITWRRDLSARDRRRTGTDARTDLTASTPEQELRYLWKSKVVPLCNEIRHGLTVSEGKFFMRVFRACDEMVETICEWREQQDARKSDPEV